MSIIMEQNLVIIIIIIQCCCVCYVTHKLVWHELLWILTVCYFTMLNTMKELIKLVCRVRVDLFHDLTWQPSPT